METKRAVGYCRISRKTQEGREPSIALQAEKMQLYCDLHGWNLVGPYEDEGYSGKTMDRPAMQQAIAMVQSQPLEVKAFLVYRLDRACRNLLDLMQLLQTLEHHKVAFLSVCDSWDTSTPAGRLIVHILGSVAEWEREIIRERTCDGLRRRRMQGRITGGSEPYGWRHEGGFVVEVPEEQALLTFVLREYPRLRSFRRLQESINRAGFRNRKGKIWSLRSTYLLWARIQRDLEENNAMALNLPVGDDDELQRVSPAWLEPAHRLSSAAPLE